MNSAKACFRHTKFYSTVRKLAVERKRSKLKPNDLLFTLVTTFGWKVLLIWQIFFENWNDLNLKLQGKSTKSSSFAANLQAFYSKLQNSRRKVMQGNVMFEELWSVVEKTEERDESLRTSIRDHLQSIKIEFQRYFPELKKKLHLYEIRSLPLWL